MPISAGKSLLIILVVTLTTFFTRLLPFVVFGGKQQVPKLVSYLGVALPPAVITILLVYCVKDIDFTNYKSILPQLIAMVTVVVIHQWKKNNLLSIGGGTILYMILIQFVFKI